MTETYINIIKEISDETIITSSGESLDSWKYHYINRNQGHNGKQLNNPQLGTYTKKTFIPYIKKYMAELKMKQDIVD